MDEFIELTDQQLAHVGGGFLGLLAAIGPIASLAGQITGAIGQSKQAKAEKIASSARSEAAAAGLGDGSGQGSGQAQPRMAAANMMGEGAVQRPSGAG